MAMRVLVIDPGGDRKMMDGNNGIMMVDGYTKGKGMNDCTMKRTLVKGFIPVGDWLTEHIHKYDLVICEDWRTHQIKQVRDAITGSKCYANRVVGLVEYLCAVHNVEAIYPLASNVKGKPMPKIPKSASLTDDDSITSGNKKHVNDALKHFAAYTLQKKYKGKGRPF